MRDPEQDTFSIRRAVSGDVDALTAIDKVCFPAGIAYPRREISALVRAPDTLTLVVEHAATVAGFASLGLQGGRFSNSLPEGELITIDVLVEFRRRHLGWRLHEALADWLRAGGGHNLELHVAVDNAPAISFYRRLGYETIARVPDYYLGTTDAWRMRKSLP